MPRNKDLKRLVRARMSKTGESYTSARAQILRKPAARARVAAPAQPSAGYAALAGWTDALIEQKTGRDWKRWVTVLDSHGADRMPHRDIAALISSEYQIPGWWTQTVAVGYERIKGLRAIGQRRDGSYEANKSRTFAVPVKKLFDAWAKAATRRRWLDEPGVTVRTAMSPKSIRLGWNDGSIVAVGFIAKGKGRSAVAIQHTKLPDKQSAERLKRFWSERFDSLGAALRA